MQHSRSPLLKMAAIHDISGIGHCSLAVILPVVSAMGIQACPVPTAVLSAHTGGFGEVAFADLTTFTNDALSHYKCLHSHFDCIYSGFLASESQIDVCLSYLSHWKHALKVVDPVMGDHGKPYRTYTKGMISRMGELVGKADVITPNLTEASLLLGESVPASLSQQEAKSLLSRLSKLGPNIVLITGVPMQSGEICNLCYERENSLFWSVRCHYAPVSYPGTGDLFAAVLTGGLLQGDSLPIAMERATRFLEIAIHTTFSYGTDPKEGVLFEKCLPWLFEIHLFTDFTSI